MMQEGGKYIKMFGSLLGVWLLFRIRHI